LFNPGLFDPGLFNSGLRLLAPGLLVSRLLVPGLFDARLFVPLALDLRPLDLRPLAVRAHFRLALRARAHFLLTPDLVAQLLFELARPLRLLAIWPILPRPIPLRAVLFRPRLILPLLVLPLPAFTNCLVALLLHLAHLPIAILAHAAGQRFPIEHRSSRGRGRFGGRPIYSRRAVRPLADGVGHAV
jgi:hypothetical protein